jgi:hypothetical protein
MLRNDRLSKVAAALTAGATTAVRVLRKTIHSLCNWFQAVDDTPPMPGCYPQLHHGLPVEAVVMQRIPRRYMWINLWKLWIAPYG